MSELKFTKHTGTKLLKVKEAERELKKQTVQN